MARSKFVISTIIIIAIICFFIYQRRTPISRILSEYQVPHIKFENNVYNLGKIQQDHPIEQVFRFKNSGHGNLMITKVHPSCQCLSVNYPKDIILPGEQREIKATFDPAGQYDEITRTLLVLTNDPENGSVLLRINAYVDASIVVPSEVNYGECNIDNIIKKQVIFQVANRYNAADIIVETKSVNIDIGPKTLIHELNGRNVFQVPLRISGWKQSGNYTENIIVKLKGNDEKIIKVSGVVKDTIEIHPSTFHFGIVNTTEEKSTTVSIRIEGKSGFIIENIEYEHINCVLTSEITEVEKFTEYEIKLTLKTPKTEGLVKGMINIYTNLNDKAISIPCIAYVMRGEGVK